MVGLAADADLGVLGLHEVADVGAVGQHGSRTQARERPDRRCTFHHDSIEVAVRAYFGAGAQLRVADPAERSDTDAVGKLHPAFEHHVDVDLDILSHRHFTAYVDARRIRQTGTCSAQRACRTTLEPALQLRELPRIVRTLHFQRVMHMHHFGGAELRRGRSEHVGEVVLALGVVIAEVVEPAAQRLAIGDEDASVDGPDLQLFLGGVLLLDHPCDVALGITHDAAVAGGVVEVGDQHRQAARRVQQPAQCRGGDQRDIAIEDQHACVLRHFRHCLLYGMAGAEAHGLFRPVQVGLARQRVADFVAAMAIDHVDAAGIERAGGGDDVGEHRPAGDLLKHLGDRGLHALALAGGQDDDVQGGDHGCSVPVDLQR